jgi:hypothetical protein
METENKTVSTVNEKITEPISFFNSDTDFVFAYKKTEKLATATYMVTGLFSDREPMKWSLRKKTGDLVSFMLGYKDIYFTERENFKQQTKTKILELVSFLEISRGAGLVSDMNFAILKQEFLNLLNVVEATSLVRRESHPSHITKTFFDVPKHVFVQPQPVQPIGHLSEEVTQVKDTYEYKKHPHRSGSLVGFTSVKNGAVKPSRQDAILALLKKSGNVTIKDISNVIKNCSEKTIQRELIAFISAGLVKKVGERRWSRYSLA